MYVTGNNQHMDWNSIGDEAVNLFREYLKINTENPPGDVSHAARFLSAILSRENVPVELLWTNKPSGRVNLLARLKGNGIKRPIMLLHHMDTVPVNRDTWTVDPYAGIKKDGYLYGRGALDMKNNGICQLMTMILLKKTNVQLDRDVIMTAVADEEMTGELGSQWIAENKWDEINAEYVLDEGGFGTQGFFTNDGRLIFSVGVSEKKILWLHLRAEGTGGHGSMPPKENANFILVRALHRIAEYKTPVTITPVVKEMIKKLGTLEDTPYNNALQRNTVSLTVMKGFTGTPPKSNVIPESSEAVLDCRLLPEQNPGEFIRQIKQIINDPRITFDYLERPVDAVVSPYDTELFQTIEAQINRLYPDAVTIPHLVIYGSDSRFFRQKGAVCYGFFPGPVTIDDYKTIHGNDERIRENSLKTAVQIYYNVIKNFCASSPV